MNIVNGYLSHSFEGMEDNSFVFVAKKKFNEKKRKFKQLMIILR